MKKWFITGTDTDCGKTYVTCQLLHYFQKHQQLSYAIKPIVSGCERIGGQWVNEDISALSSANRTPIGETISPWCFPLPVSPHLAAKEVGYHLNLNEVIKFCNLAQFEQVQHLFIEGAGGLMVPLTSTQTWVDMITAMNIPIILVVGMRLGCLNHALLTAAVIEYHQLPFAGWIANCLDKNMALIEDNIDTLKQKLKAPLLTTIDYNGHIEKMQAF